MAQPITISLLRDPEFLASDFVQLRIDGDQQPDRVTVWGPERNQMGFGFASSTSTGFGGAIGLPFGEGAFGAGLFGEGGEAVSISTLNRFVAGDYDFALRSVDALGNATDWTADVTIEHRPAPPPPFSLGISGTDLTWNWTDP